MTARDEQERREREVMKPAQAICKIINEVFSEPFMPDGFVEAKAHVIDNNPTIFLRIGARDVKFTLDGNEIGRGTRYPLGWRDAVEQLGEIWNKLRSEYANI